MTPYYIHLVPYYSSRRTDRVLRSLWYTSILRPHKIGNRLLLSKIRMDVVGIMVVVVIVVWIIRRADILEHVDGTALWAAFDGSRTGGS